MNRLRKKGVVTVVCKIYNLELFRDDSNLPRFILPNISREAFHRVIYHRNRPLDPLSPC